MLRKTTALLGLSVMIAGLLFPLVSLAGGHYTACTEVKDGQCDGVVIEVYYDGIVPCGKKVFKCPGWDENADGDARAKCKVEPDDPNDPQKAVLTETPMHCQLCHFFVMIDGIIDYVLIQIVPPLTILMLVVGGVMFYFGGAKPELLSMSKTLFKGVAIGLVLIYGAYMIVGIVLSVLGAADVNPIGGDDGIFNSQNGVFRIKCPIEMPKP